MNRSLTSNKYFLYATAFFSGMSVMAIELGASRLLAPYFSSSQIVWTVIIGTIMIALALGNVIGGRMADKNPSPAKLYGRLLIAAVWTALIPFVGKYVIAGITLLLAMFVNSNFLVWASLAACFLLFVFPLLLLGTVSPCLVKYSVRTLEENGRITGELEALNTIGSIIGTFVPTFVTIPLIGTARTFLIFAAILAVLSSLYFLSANVKKIRGVAVTAIILVLTLLPFNHSFAFWDKTLVHEDESIYNYLQVKETDRSVILSTNVMEGVQSIMMKDGGLTGMYYDYALAAPLMAGLTPNGDNGGKNLLILGLGTGTYAKQVSAYFPNTSVEGVEIDQKIVDLAREYFDLPEEVNVSVYDGRAYLQNAGLYDTILVDAYQDITIPFQMSSMEFFEQVKSRLKDDGVMAVNLNMRSSKADAINDYLCDTITEVFGKAYTIVVPNTTNTVLFASKNPGMLAGLDGVFPNEDEAFASLMGQVRENLREHTSQGRILTDDKAPVELLGMQVLDEIINDTLDTYRNLLNGDEPWISYFLGGSN